VGGVWRHKNLWNVMSSTEQTKVDRDAETANIKQNTTNKGFFQGRRVK
jgi:hypothetical protein